MLHKLRTGNHIFSMDNKNRESYYAQKYTDTYYIEEYRITLYMKLKCTYDFYI